MTTDGWTLGTAALEHELDSLVDESRERMRLGLAGRDRLVSTALAASFVAAAAAMAAVLPWGRSPTLLEAAAVVVTLAILSRVQFEIGAGVALPTQLALVPMLFVLPAATVPLAATAGYALGALADCVRGRLHPERLTVIIAYSWHAVGPALVFVAAGDPAPEWRDWPLYAAALGAQFVFDLATSLVRDALALGVPARALLPSLLWVYLVDCLLFPLGLLAAFAALQQSYVFLVVLAPAALLALLARDRRARIDLALELTSAYRTANEVARRDVLTGVGNRLAWEEALAWAEKRPSPACSVLLVDLDGLKATNDALGHDAGDRLLQIFARLIGENVRDRDIVARVGGDEFGVLMPEADAGVCADVARRLEVAIASHGTGDGRALSAAIGCASRPPASSLAEALRIADARMYAGKQREEPQTSPA